MIKLEADLSLDQSRQLVEKLKENIRKEENRLSKEKQNFYTHEYFSEDYYNEFYKMIRKVYHYLSKNNFPRDGVCSHFGVNQYFRSDIISFSEKDGNLLISSAMGDDAYLENRSIVQYSLESHQKRIEIISKAIGSICIDKWNDNEGSNSFSAVFKTKAPESLICCINNYRNNKTDIGSTLFYEWIKAANF